MACTGCSQKPYSSVHTDTMERTLEIVYKRGQTCYAIDPEDENSKLYAFTAAGQPVFDQNNQSATGTGLLPGMLVNVEYDGYILETSPSQFSGISRITICDTRANNVDFLVSQISGMFPSTKPEGADEWEIGFGGDELLSSSEKAALEFILREDWAGASVTVEPGQMADPDRGRIYVECSNLAQNGMDLTIVVNDGTMPMTKAMHVELIGGLWTIV